MYKEIIDWIDLILVPLYLCMFILILNWIKKRNPHNILIQKYLVKGFVFKVVCAIFYGMLLHFYYGFGDSLSYFQGAIYIKQQISQGNESLRILITDSDQAGAVYGPGAGIEGNWVVERVAILLAYISFNRYLIVTLFFAIIAYSGMFKMYLTFCDILPEAYKKIAWIVLFFPSVSVYGSGVMKDTLCMAALGWMFYSGYQMFIKRHFKLKFMVILLLCIIVIASIKVYILAAIVPPYIFYLILVMLRKIKNVFARRIVFPLLLVMVGMFYMIFSDSIDNALGVYSGETLFKTMKAQQSEYLRAEDAEQGALFNLGELDPTLSGFIKMMPAGIVASIFRPFIWESKKFIMVFSALESLIFLWFTLYVMYKTGFIRFFRELISDPFVFFCISYSLMFAALIGISTFNFGTLTRYRIPLIPFYMVGLLTILYHAKATKLKTLHETTG